MKRVDKETRNAVIDEEDFLDVVFDLPAQLTEQQKKNLYKRFPETKGEDTPTNYVALASLVADCGGVQEVKAVLNMTDEEFAAYNEESGEADKEASDAAPEPEEDVAPAGEALEAGAPSDAAPEFEEDVAPAREALEAGAPSEDAAAVIAEEGESEEATLPEVVDAGDAEDASEKTDDEAFWAQFSDNVRAWLKDAGLSKETVEEMVNQYGKEIFEAGVMQNINQERAKAVREADKAKKAKKGASKESEE